jgi:hypothetical protein
LYKLFLFFGVEMSPNCGRSIRHIIQVNFLGFTVNRYLNFFFVSLGFYVRFFPSDDFSWYTLVWAGVWPFSVFRASCWLPNTVITPLVLVSSYTITAVLWLHQICSWNLCRKSRDMGDRCQPHQKWEFLFWRCQDLRKIREGILFQLAWLVFLRNPTMGTLVDATCADSGSFSQKFSRIRCLPSFHCLPRSFR